MLNLTPMQINSVFPIVGIVSYPGGVIVRRNCTLLLSQMRHSHIRGIVSMVNKRSMNKLALLVRSTEVQFLSVMTLTYGLNYPLDGRKAKKDLNHFMISLKRAFGPFEYVWVVEFQARGAPHFHLATTLAPPTFDDRWRFASIWTEISVPFIASYSSWLPENSKDNPGELRNTGNSCMAFHSHKKAWEAIRKKDGVGRYFAKYANKLRQKKVPQDYHNIGRFWGASRGVRLPEGKHYHGTEAQVRELAGQYGRDLKSWDVLPKIILLG